jgi:hypothetical protein
VRIIQMLVASLAAWIALGAFAAAGDPIEAVYHITTDPKAKVVPSGVGEIARLRSQEGYAHLKP